MDSLNNTIEKPTNYRNGTTIGRVIRVHKDDRDAISNGQLTIGNWQFYKKSSGQLQYQQRTSMAIRLLKDLSLLLITYSRKGYPQ